MAKSPSVYGRILITNVRRILGEQRRTKADLAEAAGISFSILSDLTRGKGNPSLATMEAIARALDVPLTVLLERTDLDQALVQHLVSKKTAIPSAPAPAGHEWVTALLPAHKAFLVKKWADEAEQALRRPPAAPPPKGQ